jgi:hypothetical protein
LISVVIVLISCPSAFLINHSFEFNVAMAASFVEYFVELWLFPGLKTFSPVIYLGLLGAIFGQGKPLPQGGPSATAALLLLLAFFPLTLAVSLGC